MYYSAHSQPLLAAALWLLALMEVNEGGGEVTATTN